MNTDVLFSSRTDMWETPQWLFDKLNQIHNFTLDVCATSSNKKCEKFFSPEEDGLKKKWEKICWMNPPYGRTIGMWIEKAYRSFKEGERC